MAKWYIQDTHVQLSKLKNTADALDRNKIQYEGFGVFPGVPTKIEFNDKRSVIRSSVKVLVDSFSDSSLRMNMFYSDGKFDQQNLMNINLPMVNSHGIIDKFNDMQDKSFNNDMFVKPSSDVKRFAGSIIKAGSTLRELLETDIKSFGMDDNPNILYSELRTDIYTEYRISVVNGEIVHSSKYFQDGILNTSSIVPDYVITATKSFISTYEPHDIFVIDVCDTDNGVEIIEFNCWNCSGIYSWDVDYMFNMVNNYVDRLS